MKYHNQTSVKEHLNFFAEIGINKFNFAALVQPENGGKGVMLQHDRERDAEEVLNSLGWGWAKNYEGMNIYLRPARFAGGEFSKWPYIFFDDVPDDIISKISETRSFSLRTSPGRHHLWIGIDDAINESERRAIQTFLRPRFLADTGSLSGEHFGRAVGFKNIKRGGYCVSISKRVGGALLRAADLLSRAAGQGIVVAPLPPKGERSVSDFQPAGALPDKPAFESNGDESSKEYGFVLGRLKFISNFKDPARRAELLSKLVEDQIQRALSRGKRRDYKSAEEYVRATIAKAERNL